MNVILDPQKDRKGGGTPINVGAAETINAFLEENSWMDVWRIHHPDTFGFTWKRRQPLVLSRLDYFLTPVGNMGLIDNCRIEANCLSDHSMLEMTLAMNDMMRGKGYWKMNVSMLEEKEYIDNINRIIDGCKHTNVNLEKGLRWESMKKDIIEYSQFHGKMRASLKRERKAILTKKLNSLEKKLACINLGSLNAVRIIERVNEKIDQIKEQLQSDSAKAIRGTMIRSKARFIELGEKNTKYFFNLERANARNKAMSAIMQEETGRMLYGTKEILNEQKLFYKKLYTSNPQIKFEMHVPPKNKLTDAESKQSNESISYLEISAAIKQTQRFKSPGPDGIPADFYKVFFCKIKEELLDAFNYAFQVKRLFPSGREGYISLIPKRGRDPKILKSWRPIVLLCCDYKILSKIITNRVKVHLNKLMSPEQNGFISGRNIASNIRQVIDTMHFAEAHKINSLLLQLDLEKAFDRVEYESLYGALKYFNFGDQMIQWVRVLFADFRLATTNNGYISEWFMPTRGLFQGNPFSSVGFLHIIELFAIMIKNNPKIKGVKIKSLESLLSMFADDMNIFIMNKQSIWQELVRTIDIFEHISGMKINYDKSLVYRMGSANKTKANAYTLKKLHWSTGPINVLGVMVTESDSEMEKLNYQPILRKARATLNVWRMRNLSLMGSIMVFNSLIASLFTYRMAVLPKISKWVSEEYDDLARLFIWRGKKAKISLTILQGNKQQGGLGLCNIRHKDMAIKSHWVYKTHQTDIIKELASELIGIDCELLWKASLSPEDVNKVIATPGFWKDVLYSWCRAIYQKPTSKAEFRDSQIWFNSNLTIRGKPVYYEKWHRAGIQKVNQIIKGNDEPLTLMEFNNRFGLTIPFTTLTGLQNSIAKTMQELKSSNLESVYTVKNPLDSIYSTKTIYMNLNHNDTLLKDITSKWKLTLPNMEEEFILKSIRKIYQITNIPKLRSFQYRIIFRSIITNVQLKWYKIKDTNVCTFCQKDAETIDHLFFRCNYTLTFFRNVYDWLKITDLKLDMITLLFNDITTNPKLVQNLLVLLGKHYIYKCRCSQEKPNFVAFKNIVYSYKQLEEQIAYKNNKIPLHLLKWSDIKW